MSSRPKDELLRKRRGVPNPRIRGLVCTLCCQKYYDACLYTHMNFMDLAHRFYMACKHVANSAKFMHLFECIFATTHYRAQMHPK